VFSSNWPPKQSIKHFLLCCEWLLIPNLHPDLETSLLWGFSIYGNVQAWLHYLRDLETSLFGRNLIWGDVQMKTKLQSSGGYVLWAQRMNARCLIMLWSVGVIRLWKILQDWEYYNLVSSRQLNLRKRMMKRCKQRMASYFLKERIYLGQEGIVAYRCSSH